MPPSKHTFNLVFKQQLIPKVWFLTYQTDTINDFQAGAYFSHQIPALNNTPENPTQPVYRPYSTVCVDSKWHNFFDSETNYPEIEGKNYISFMVSTKPGGQASQFFDQVQTGTSLQVIGPAGEFRLIENDNPKVFITTGTGVAPFIAMIKKQLEIEPKSKIKVFFGVWVKADNFAPIFFKEILENPETYPNFELFIVVDGFKPEDLDEKTFGGRVTTIVPENVDNFLNTDFYICGHPLMVADMQVVLEQKGCILGKNMFMEKFGTIKPTA
jgi:ferredoxin-NADP reductase